MQQVNPSDPAGLHLLALLASDRPPEELVEELASSLADVGAPPDDLPRLRGAGPRVTLGVHLDPDYTNRIKSRLPEGVRWVCELYLPARVQ